MGVALVRKDRAAVASTVTVRHTGMSAQSCTLTAIGCTMHNTKAVRSATSLPPSCVLPTGWAPARSPRCVSLALGL